jgi:UDP-N-acetylglucosamine 4,6-dehydratase/5-epimerase
MFEDKTVLVTGGTGSFGKHFVWKILDNHDVRRIIIFSRDELKQYEMMCDSRFSQYSKKLRFFIGDVRDKERLGFAFKGVDYVVHAAALKQVLAAEYNPFEVVKTNIVGAQNIVDCAIECDVKKVLALSTDKAAAPVNLYGATKLVSDKLFISANNYRGSVGPKLSVVRYGNVMGSRGSVIPFFLSCAKEGLLPITDPAMTRFSITLDQSVEFVIDSLNRMWGGELFVPRIPSYRIVDLAKAIAPDAKHPTIGGRPGEKLHEHLILQEDAPHVVEFASSFVIMPNSQYLDWDREQFRQQSRDEVGQYCKQDFNYNSKENLPYLSIDDLRNLISENVDGSEVITL